jgi:hypothetical protein
VFRVERREATLRAEMNADVGILPIELGAEVEFFLAPWRRGTIVVSAAVAVSASLTLQTRYLEPQILRRTPSEMNPCGLTLVNNAHVRHRHTNLQPIHRISRRRSSTETLPSCPSLWTNQKPCSPCTWTGQTRMIGKPLKGGKESDAILIFVS